MRWLAFAIVAAFFAAGARADSPGDALRALLAHPALRGAKTGVLVADLESGEVLAEHDPGRALVPASNQKILTAVAALDRWGPAHRFSTPLYVSAMTGGVVSGPLWVEGRGDPSLVSESFWSLAEELRLRGVRAIPGGIGVDAGFFAGAVHHPDWFPLDQRAYEAPTAAFAANYSAFRIEVLPGQAPGVLARLDLAPRTDYFRTQADALTVAGRGRLVLGIRRLPDASGDRVSISGSVAAGTAAQTFWRPVSLPERYAASVLRLQLEGQGIHVGPGVVLGPRPPELEELLRFRGAPLAEIVASLNKFSNNFIAEQLLKGIGADVHGPPGTWEKGTRAVEAWLAERGLADAHTVVADGSGLSPRNRVSPATFVALIRLAARDPDWGPEFLASLPLGGLDGTLRERDLGERRGVRAKTGHLRAVSSLSGVVPGAEGRRLAFSVIVNGATRGRDDVDAALDAFVSALGAPWPPQRTAAAELD